MKPISTFYAGHFFRSRTEARYAVLFDSLGLEWEYELEGFELDDGSNYLPDFYLQRNSEPFYVEIKPTIPTNEELDKAYWLSHGTKKSVLVFYGQPNKLEVTGFYYRRSIKASSKDLKFVEEPEFIIENKLIYCYQCRKISLCYDNIVCCNHCLNNENVDTLIYNSELCFLKAKRQAQQSRFEFGEEPFAYLVEI